MIETLTLLDLAFIIGLIGQLAVIGGLIYKFANWQKALESKIDESKLLSKEDDRILDKKLDNLQYELKTIKSFIDHQQEQTKTANNAQVAQLMSEIRLTRQQVNDIMGWLEKQGFKVRIINKDTLF